MSLRKSARTKTKTEKLLALAKFRIAKSCTEEAVDNDKVLVVVEVGIAEEDEEVVEVAAA